MEDDLLEVGYQSIQDQDKIERFKVLSQMGKMSLEDEAKSELLNRLAKEENVDSDCSWSMGSAASGYLQSAVPHSEPANVWLKVNEKSDTTVNQAKTLGKQADSKPTKSGSSENFDDNNNTDCASGSSVNSIKFRDEELDNIVVITVPKDEQVKEGFMYVHVDGQKVLIPKNILKSEIISAAQQVDSHLSESSSTGIVIDASETLSKSPTPSLASTIINQDTEVNGANKPGPGNSDSAGLEAVLGYMQDTLQHTSRACYRAQQAMDLTVGPRETFDANTIDEALDRSNYFEANNFMSHCSAAGSCFSEVSEMKNVNVRYLVLERLCYSLTPTLKGIVECSFFLRMFLDTRSFILLWTVVLKRPL